MSEQSARMQDQRPQHQQPDLRPGDDPALLSAMLDGEVSAAEAALACDLCRQQPGQRQDWRAYSVIGDVLRSTDLAVNGRNHQTFMERFSARLAEEPAILAPAPSSVAATEHPLLGVKARNVFHLPRRMAPWGMAAGLALVTGLAWLQRPAPPTADEIVASLPAEPTNGLMLVGDKASAQSLANPSNLRNSENTAEEFEPYVAAHRQFQFTQSLAPTSGYLRNARYDPAQR